MSFVDFSNDLIYNQKKLLSAIKKSKSDIKHLLSIKHKNYNNFVKPFYEHSEEVEYFFTMISHLNSVKNNKQTIKTYNKVLPIISEYSIDLSTNQEIFNAFLYVKNNDNSVSKVQQKVINESIKDFKLSGVALNAKKRNKLKKIKMQLSELSKDFSQNLIDANNKYELVIPNYKDVKELPKSDINQSKIVKKDKTYYRFTLQMPSYLSYMTYGSNKKYREELYKAYSSRAPQNAIIIDKILLLRNKEAKLLGFKNFAQLSIANKDAKSVKSVEEFLIKIANKSKKIAFQELKGLEKFASRKLKSHDIAYYSEKMRKKHYDLDEEMVMNYFKKDDVVKYVIDFIKDSFNVEIKINKKTTTWDNSVVVYDFYKKDKCFSRLYLDLENNKSKKGGAWMHNFQTHYKDSQNKEHPSSAFVVCNFMPTTKEQPSLLKHSDIVTLFHELGHAIHHMFSKVDEISLSGVNGVSWDVIEFPSQFLEQFAYDKDVLKKIGKHYKTNKKISNKIIDKIINAKNFLAGLSMIRQCEFSLFDLVLHKKLHQNKQVQNLLNSIRKKYSPIIPPSYNKFQNGFSHIFSGGYASGYYSYKWAEVLSADLFIKHQEKPILNQYKKNILYKGASENMQKLLQKITHKKPSIQSLFKLYNIS